MKTRVAILGAVTALVFVVLALEPSTAPERQTERPDAQASGATADPTRMPAAATVLLFADAREAESRCGCAEVIRIARGAGDVRGVTMREFNTRREEEQAKRYGVRVSPTVIIADANGMEQARFEGESGQVITELRTAIDALAQSSPAPKGGETR